MIKQRNIPVILKNAVWNLYIGINNTTASCFCCKLEHITYANFYCGYVIPKKNNGSVTVSNLRPICELCNSSINNNNMFDLMKQYGFDEIQSPYYHNNQQSNSPQNDNIKHTL